ncbi:hypothetical protein [Bacillus sp. FJAT-26390]|uniref:hypothetical protein n=1 Tax=Bacillus sp. FJAT-26390 TaxID=1743142 RepID=UPI000807EF92|nr:hypothetical protein [Bacillus sp. FJAT-26390]OBZ11078.1 hypothetical protein A7975_19075 [Bacillus sp. FJAT-26390]
MNRGIAGRAYAWGIGIAATGRLTMLLRENCTRSVYRRQLTFHAVDLTGKTPVICGDFELNLELEGFCPVNLLFFINME